MIASALVPTLREAVLVVAIEDVDVRREVELLAAELAHPQHAEAARSGGGAAFGRAMKQAEPRVVEAHRGLERLGRETRQLARHLGVVCPAGAISLSYPQP